MKASKNAHDWHCEDHDTYGWVGEECRKCPVAPSETTALREQVEKLRKALTKWRYLDSSYNWCCGYCGNEEGGEHKEGCAHSIPNLATPVLNRIRAEGMEEAEKIVRKRVQWVSNGQGVQYRSTAPESISAETIADEIRARANELRKQNG